MSLYVSLNVSLKIHFLFRFQAIECFLAKVKPKNNAELWEQDAISRFEDLTHGKHIGFTN